MADEGQRFEAPDGNTLQFVRITDALLEMEATYGGNANRRPRPGRRARGRRGARPTPRATIGPWR